MKRRAMLVVMAALVVAVTAGACAKKKVVPVPRPNPGPTSTSGGGVPPPAPPEPVAEPSLMPPMPVPLPEDTIGSKSLDDLNRDSPLKPVFFEVDSSELNSSGQSTLQENAGVMKKFATWQITIEGHCDERGSAEYNLALGERRALVTRDYLISLGIPATRVRTVSYGKEFPFDPGRDEGAYAKNRRAHFVITAR